MDTNNQRPRKLAEHQRGAIRLGDFLERRFDVDVELLGKMILAKSIGMIAGPRGGGKSWLALLFAYAIAGGKPLTRGGSVGAVPSCTWMGKCARAASKSGSSCFMPANTTDDAIEMAERNFHIIQQGLPRDNDRLD